jgi:hypothetical protein
VYKSFPSIACGWAIFLSIFLIGCEAKNQTAPGVQQSTLATTPVEVPAARARTNSVFRIKAGLSVPLTDTRGNVWLADQGFEGGDTIDRDGNTTIAGTKDPSLFLSEHYGMNAFSCKLPNGKYTANLYFAETFEGITGPGQRVFSFNAQGHEFKDFDVWVKASGPNRAYIESVPVEITNGVFRIDFTSNIENPQINAIEILPQP